MKQSKTDYSNLSSLCTYNNNKVYTNIGKMYANFHTDVNYKNTYVCILFMCVSP